jgi:hypothetical protein
VSKEGDGAIEVDGEQGRRRQGVGKEVQRELEYCAQVGYREFRLVPKQDSC